MKNFLIFPLLIVVLSACQTSNRTPYAGAMGDYGFTYDLDNSPSPFVDTAYRPLTLRDLTAPIIITVTNPSPPKIIYQNGPEIGVTHYSGSVPEVISAPPVAPQINEASGANRNANNQAGPAPGYGPGGVSYGAPAYFFDNSTNGSGTNTNVLSLNTNVTSNITNTNNFASTNINGTNFVVQTNFSGTNMVATNSNPGLTNLAGGTNINEAAGAQTNGFNPLFPRGQQPVQAQSNGAFNVNNAVAPPDNRVLLNPQTTSPNQNPNTATRPTAAPNQQTPASSQQGAPNQNQNTTTTPSSGNTRSTSTPAPSGGGSSSKPR